MDSNKNYFIQTFLLLIISTVAFVGFKLILPKKILEQSSIDSKNVVIDSMLLEALDENAIISNENDDNAIHVSNSKANSKSSVQYATENFEDYKGYQNIVSFYEKLQQLEITKTGKVRVAYFGDSMNDGDMIVQDVRRLFQEQFGGQGVGFVNITSESAASRATITHEFSGNWKTQSYLKIKKPIRPFGANGHVFFANDTLHASWVKYSASRFKFLTQLDNPTLFYGNASNKDASISYIVGKDTIYKKLNGENQLNTLKLADHVKSIKVNFINAKNVPIYGFNFDDGKGVHVDNFSNRGNSGLPISLFSPEMMQAFHAKLNYDLVVLHYGTNVLNYGTYDYSWYEKKMQKVVEHIKLCFPGAAVLIISTADKSTKYDLEMKTDSAVVPLAMAQKKYALKSQSGFINLYKLMGGYGSMVQWVEGTPSRANKDYTHFNYTGSKEVAKLIYDEINTGFNIYKTLRKKSLDSKRKKDSVFSKIDSTND